MKETLRKKLYLKARDALREKGKDRAKALYKECISMCEQEADKGKFTSEVPKELAELMNNSDELSLEVVRQVKELLGEQDLYVLDHKQNTFNSPLYKITFNSESSSVDRG